MEFNNYSNFQGVNTATTLTGTLIKQQTAGANFENRGCNKTQAKCNAGEWFFATLDCGSGGWRQFCTNPDIQMCPSITVPSTEAMGKYRAGVLPTGAAIAYTENGPPNTRPVGTLSGKPTSVEFADKDAAAISFGGAPQTIRCTYPATAIRTLDDVNTWENNFGVNDPSYNNDLMPTFCAQVSTNCDIDPVTNTKRARCSRFHDAGQSGTKCREWASKMKATSAGVQIVNNTFDEFCRANNTDDCKCINRTKDSLYNKIKADPAFGKLNDVCWWKPCQQATDYLVTSELKADCTAVICQNITNITGSTINDIKQEGKINCDASTSPSPPTPSPSPSPPGPKPDNGGEPEKKKFPLWTLAIIIPLALLLVGGILYALFGKKSKGMQGVNASIDVPSPSSLTPAPTVNSYDNSYDSADHYDDSHHNNYNSRRHHLSSSFDNMMAGWKF